MTKAEELLYRDSEVKQQAGKNESVEIRVIVRLNGTLAGRELEWGLHVLEDLVG